MIRPYHNSAFSARTAVVSTGDKKSARRSLAELGFTLPDRPPLTGSARDKVGKWHVDAVRKVVRDFLAPELAAQPVTGSIEARTKCAEIINDQAARDGFPGIRFYPNSQISKMDRMIGSASQWLVYRQEIAEWLGVPMEAIWPHLTPYDLSADARLSDISGEDLAPPAARARIVDAIRVLGTQREVAPLLGISVPTLQRIVAGTGPIHLDLLCRLHGATGLTFAQLLGEGANADQSITSCIVAGLSTSRDYPLTKDSGADSITDGGISDQPPPAGHRIVIELDDEEIREGMAARSLIREAGGRLHRHLPLPHIQLLTTPWGDWVRASRRLAGQVSARIARRIAPLQLAIGASRLVWRIMRLPARPAERLLMVLLSAETTLERHIAALSDRACQSRSARLRLWLLCLLTGDTDTPAARAVSASAPDQSSPNPFGTATGFVQSASPAEADHRASPRPNRHCPQPAPAPCDGPSPEPTAQTRGHNSATAVHTDTGSQASPIDSATRNDSEASR